MRNILFVLLILAGFSCTLQAQDPSPVSSEQSALDFAQSMGLGWNLGNQMDAHINGTAVETGWGNQPATEATFKALKKAGFSTVRIPVTWMGHIGVAPAYTLEKAWLDRVEELVKLAKKQGFKVIINIHHDGYGAETDAVKRSYHWLNLPIAAADEDTNTRIKQQLAMIWLQIGQRFKNEGEYLIFETMNEPQDGGWGNGGNTTDGGAQYRVLNEWNQVCVSAIRAAGGENSHRYIGIPGYSANAGLTVEHLLMPQDEVENRLMISVHSYDPWDYAGEAKVNTWGNPNGAPGADEQAYETMLNRLYNKYVRVGIPVYMGEFGCVRRVNQNDERNRLYYLGYVCKAMQKRKIPAIYWDNGNARSGADGFGVMDHSTGHYTGNGEEVVKAMVNAYNSENENK